MLTKVETEGGNVADESDVVAGLSELVNYKLECE